MDDAWFVLEKGRGRLRLRPRGAPGWMAILVFMLVVLAPTLLIPLLGLHPLWTLAWLPWFGLAMWLFFVWARPRAKVIDLDLIEADYDEFLAWKRRGKR